jgi:hypothetical protein
MKFQLSASTPRTQVVAGFVVAQGGAEHGELVRVPAANDVQPEAAVADMVSGDKLFGRDNGVEQRRVHGAEDGQPLGGGEQTGGPGDGFERFALIVSVAAVALPAADRQHELDAGGVGHLRQTQIVRPGPAPAFGDHGNGAAGGAVGAEQPQLESVRRVECRAVGLGWLHSFEGKRRTVGSATAEAATVLVTVP